MLSVAAIVLGTAVVAGTLVLTDMLHNAYDGILRGTVADINVEPAAQAGGAIDIDMELDAAVVSSVAAVDGVAQAHGKVVVFDAYLLDANGAVMTTGAPGIGANWITAPAYGGQAGLSLTAGRSPAGPDEVVIDPTSLTKGRYALGDRISIVTAGPRGVVKPVIVGTGLYGAARSAGGSTYAFFDTGTAQDLFLGGRDTFNGIWVTVDPGADPAHVAQGVQAVLPHGFSAKAGADAAAELQSTLSSSLSFVTAFLLIFAAVALLVGGFLIVNTFTIVLAQRAHELALFRAVGATRSQLFWSVIFEGAVLAVFGSTLGVLLGYLLAFGIRGGLGQIGFDVSDAGMPLTARTVVVTGLVGVVCTLVACLRPARRASKVAPVVAMADPAAAEGGLGKRRAVGLVVVAGGAALLLVGAITELGARLFLVGLGAFALLLGVAALSPLLGAPLVWVLGRLGAALFGAAGHLAEVNAVRHPRRTAATASALMVGIALITAVGTIAAVTKASTDAAIEDAMRSDFVIQRADGSPFSPAVADAVAGVDGVEAVHRIRYLTASINGAVRPLGALSPASVDRVVTQRLTAGSLDQFSVGAVLLEEALADQAGLRVGDALPATVNGQDIRLRVAGIFASNPRASLAASILTTLDTFQLVGARQVDSVVAVEARPQANLAAVRAGLQQAVAAIPLVAVADRAEYAKAQAASVDRVLGVMYGLLALSVVIALLGIVNTLSLSILERTREIGLLRAVGLERGQVRRMVIVESLIIAMLGASLGLVLGLVFALAVQRALVDQGLTVFAWPWGQVVSALVVAVAVGLLASLVPAARASRVDVLRAMEAL